MFNFLHPRPVENRKPVAEMAVRQEARVAINSNTVLLVQRDQVGQKSLVLTQPSGHAHSGR